MLLGRIVFNASNNFLKLDGIINSWILLIKKVNQNLLTCIDEENLSDQYEGATKDSTLSNKTFLSIVERFALNATSRLDQRNTSIREDVAYVVG